MSTDQIGVDLIIAVFVVFMGSLGWASWWTSHGRD